MNLNNLVLRLTLLLALFVLIPTFGCNHPLPEADSPTAQLYQTRCGRCHAPFNPRVLTSAMWDRQVSMMQTKMAQAGLPPLTPDERQNILEYLMRNAGTQ